ncbi:uncharacterized protein L969DRAFT_84990 [Mixia osmundae IAM 14324]|uniref:Mitochondrial aspartate-glutamate transporter AGC1 n=1 Tax=Mixia osmundae (strain CBS 9802 / IAM 14324 / JCM 22182 / KY 12970) TaxID=764103 RepID=G7DXG8_MIXOS|nr:uncharacterized protein L969DRAFT_84990 [Mixia osmundae IAM 14324]KEI41228.1 hypothetical protein L969DRAFT_84990 [Mixia osmundae IAM 14324]GAA95278.1 hypothetical protein E5Q_01934 [Mixia osmundae IAM 14324]
MASKGPNSMAEIKEKAHETKETLRETASSAARSVGLPVAASNPESLSGATTESELARWRRNFEANAKASESSDTKYLDLDSFVDAIAPKGDLSGKIGRRQYGNLFRVADAQQKGRISFEEFAAFEALLKKPDADFEVAFKFFDLDGSGTITFDEFKNVFAANLGPDAIPFDFDSPWVHLYLGKRAGNHVLGYQEFTQLMKGLQGERLRQAFHYLDKESTGYVTVEQFSRIINELARHKLSESVLERLPTIASLTPGGKVSYSEAIAFHNVIREMDMVEKVIRDAIAKSSDGKIDRKDFLNSAAQSTRYGIFTPMEVSIIFHFAGMGSEDPRLKLSQFAQLLDPKWERPVMGEPEPLTTSILTDIAKSAYNFCLGGIAGATGATAVYPIDLVKTRMQNQRSKVVGELLYKNSLDCVRKVYKNEGFAGFYRGLPPQLIGVAPEKAIKLTMNDLVRRKTKDPETGKVPLIWELVAGATAGASQVVFTNPLEIVKIRLQMQGEAAKTRGAENIKRGALHIIRQLGLIGLYKGSSACLLRDVPFSAIYFTGYSHLKSDIFHEGRDGKKLGFGETLAAASIAGMPSAYLTTPADVIKTRLQSEARKGESTYKGLMDAGTKIFQEEGARALFKGGPARVLRSSPQFGVTLVAYEYLQAALPYPGSKKPSSLLASSEDITRIRARNALRVLLDAHSDWGARGTQGVKRS